MPSNPSKITPDHENRQRRWLKRIETLVPQMIKRAEENGGIVVARLGTKRLSGNREIRFSLEARLVHTDSGGAHEGHISNQLPPEE